MSSDILTRHLMEQHRSARRQHWQDTAGLVLWCVVLYGPMALAVTLASVGVLTWATASIAAAIVYAIYTAVFLYMVAFWDHF